MEACAAVEKEFDKLSEKYVAASKHVQLTLDDYINSLKGFCNELFESKCK